jgi:cardiolipin synthase
VLINPYFLPIPKVRKAIEKAIDDGVKVTLLLSEKGDIPMVPDGVWRIGYKLMKRGAHVYMYTGGFNHSKVMCVDCKFCTIGSANLNSRSLRYDYETNIFVFGEDDTKELQKYIELDIEKSFKLTEEIYRQRSCWDRFCGWLVVLFTPIL